MIKVDISKGELSIKGMMDDILTEYVLLTQTVLKHVSELTDDETSFQLLAKMGQIAAENYKDKTDLQKIYDNIMEAVKDVLPL